ncbi:MAG: diacylglycerol kinase family protein [Breznakia sp.]
MKSFLDKFRWAIRGAVYLFQDQGVRIQMLGFSLTILVFYCLKLTVLEWTIIAFVCGFVVFAEMLNTIIERILDYQQPNFDKEIGKMKDMSAGLVLFACIIATIVGVLMIIHKLS